MGLCRSRNYEFVGEDGVRNGGITKREMRLLITQPSTTWHSLAPRVPESDACLPRVGQVDRPRSPNLDHQHLFCPRGTR